jgi:5-deoxy-glucuronate isomerase
MAKLLVRPDTKAQRQLHITPKSAGWEYLGFDLYRLGAGESVSGETGTDEACLVLVSGKMRVLVDGRPLGTTPERASPFDGKPSAAYVPAGAGWTVEAEHPLEVAVCLAPGGKTARPAKLILPDMLTTEERGRGTNTRYATNIVSEHDDVAENLLVVEVITPGGHWSSYPPHKHDQDNLPHESRLEEVYYHRTKPSGGFAFQRVYTDDRSLDETMTVTDGDVSMVPRGYHPVGAAHGYDLYYLNVMAGPRRVWRIHNDPAHSWMLG